MNRKERSRSFVFLCLFCFTLQNKLIAKHLVPSCQCHVWSRETGRESRSRRWFMAFRCGQNYTLEQRLVSVEWRHRLTTQLVSVLSFSTRVFFFQLDSNLFFSTQISKFRLVFSFSFVNIYFANLDSYFYCIRCILQVSTSVLCCQHVFTIGIILSATERHNDSCFFFCLSLFVVFMWCYLFCCY